jgi:hypothetical protein
MKIDLNINTSRDELQSPTSNADGETSPLSPMVKKNGDRLMTQESMK